MQRSFFLALAVAVVWSGAQAGDLPFGSSAKEQTAGLVESGSLEAQILTVPANTEAAIQLLSGIHTQVSHENDPVRAQLLQPVYVNGRVALPSGTLLDGRITMIRPARRMRRSAELAFRFDTITLPEGQAHPVSVVLAGLEEQEPLKVKLDSEGCWKGEGDSGWKRIAGGLVALGAATTAGATLGGSAALAAVLPAGGSAFLSYAFLLPHGKDIHIPPDTRLRVRLNHPVTVRVPW